MKPRLLPFSQRYLTALRTHLQPGGRPTLVPAHALGERAAVEGWDTLALARIHEHALVKLKATPSSKKLFRQATAFFTAANTRIEQTYRAAQKGQAHLSQAQRDLSLRTAELAVSRRALQRGLTQRKVMAEAAEKSGLHYKKSLEESLQLQKLLRKLTHRVMMAQEDERKHISRELQDEIAQTLLGINVRLLSLKQHARKNSKGFKEEITKTQQLVLKSAQSVRRVAREIGHEPGEPPAL